MRHVINSAVRRLTQAGYTRGFNTWRALVQAAHAAADKLEPRAARGRSKRARACDHAENLQLLRDPHAQLVAHRFARGQGVPPEGPSMADEVRVDRRPPQLSSRACSYAPSRLCCPRYHRERASTGLRLWCEYLMLRRQLRSLMQRVVLHTRKRLTGRAYREPLAHDDAVRAARAQQRVAPSPAREAQFSREPRRFAVGARRRLAKQRATRATHRRNVDGPLRKDGVERLVRLRPGLCIVARLLARRAPKGCVTLCATTLPLRRTRAHDPIARQGPTSGGSCAVTCPRFSTGCSRTSPSRKRNHALIQRVRSRGRTSACSRRSTRGRPTSARRSASDS